MRRGNQWSGSLSLLSFQIFAREFLDDSVVIFFFIFVSVKDILDDDILPRAILSRVRLRTFVYTRGFLPPIALRRKKVLSLPVFHRSRV